MCGPSNQETMAQGKMSSLSSSLTSAFNQYFGAQSSVLSGLRNIFTPIAQAGPDQQGFGPQELAALETGGAEAVGRNYDKASVALNNQLASRGGGSEFLPKGADAALKATLATSAANELTNTQQRITEANYETGRQNWSRATAGLNELAQQYNPTAFSGQAAGAIGQEFQMADTIQQEKNQKEAAIAGGITSLVSGVATGGLSMLNDSDFMGNLAGGKLFGSGGVFDR